MLAVEPCGWLPLPCGVPVEDIVAAVSGMADAELEARRFSTDPALRVLRALADHDELCLLLTEAGFGKGMHVLYETSGLAPALCALLALDVASVAIVTDDGAAAEEARLRWSHHSRAESFSVGPASEHAGPAGGWDSVLLDGPADPPDLLRLRAAVRPGGVVAFDVRPPSPDTTYAWDRSLQARVNAALCALPPIPPVSPSAVIARRTLASAGEWAGGAVRTVVADRLGPLSDVDRELVTQQHALADGGVLWRLLDRDDRALLSRFYDPGGSDYLLDRRDLHLTRLRSLARGCLPGG